jgi:hypothetical protein
MMQQAECVLRKVQVEAEENLEFENITRDRISKYQQSVDWNLRFIFSTSKDETDKKSRGVSSEYYCSYSYDEVVAIDY